MIINIKEAIQCGDYFLVKFDCPTCDIEHLETIKTFKSKECPCGHVFHSDILDLSDYEFRLVTGTKRKTRISIKKIRAMYELQEARCAYCIKELNLEYHVEHIIPLAVGGTNSDSNLCLSYPSCNLIASSKVFPSFCDKQNYILEVKKNRKIYTN